MVGCEMRGLFEDEWVSRRLADDADIYLLLLKVPDDIVSTKISEAGTAVGVYLLWSLCW